MTDIPVANPRSGLLAAGDELREAFDRVLTGGRYILGAEVEAFEREWAERCATTHAVGVSSGTSALALAPLAAEAGLPLVEDAAQAHGAELGGRPAGSLGDIAAFSFYPTKNLGAIGDAGAITTSSPERADHARLMREYGWRTRGDAEIKGVNARLDELQAALLRVLLPRLDAANARRAEIAAAYADGLARAPGLTLPRQAANSTHAWHLYVVEHERRDELAERLAREGVGSAVHYRPPPHLTTAFRADGWAQGTFPVAERHAETALSLPLHPGLSDADVERVLAAVEEACAAI